VPTYNAMTDRVIISPKEKSLTISKMDVEFARRAGCKAGIRVGEPGGTGDCVAVSFRDAVHWVVEQTKEFQNC